MLSNKNQKYKKEKKIIVESSSEGDNDKMYGGTFLNIADAGENYDRYA